MFLLIRCGMQKRSMLFLRHLPGNLIKLAVVLMFVFPFYWMVITSFKTYNESILFPPTLWPKQFTTEAYTLMLHKMKLLNYVKNSVIVTVCAIAIQMIVMIPAAYAFARYDFKGKNLMFSLVLVAFMWRLSKASLPRIPMPLRWLSVRGRSTTCASVPLSPAEDVPTWAFANATLSSNTSTSITTEAPNSVAQRLAIMPMGPAPKMMMLQPPNTLLRRTACGGYVCQRRPLVVPCRRACCRRFREWYPAFRRRGIQTA